MTCLVISCSHCVKIINYLAILQLLYSKDRYSGGKQERLHEVTSTNNSV